MADSTAANVFPDLRVIVGLDVGVQVAPGRVAQEAVGEQSCAELSVRDIVGILEALTKYEALSVLKNLLESERVTRAEPGRRPLPEQVAFPGALLEVADTPGLHNGPRDKHEVLHVAVVAGEAVQYDLVGIGEVVATAATFAAETDPFVDVPILTRSTKVNGHSVI